MPYSDMFKRKMIQKMTGPEAISALALSKQVDVSQTTLSKWLRNVNINPVFNFTNLSTDVPVEAKHNMTPKRPDDWSPEEKLNAVLDSAPLSDEELGTFLRKKGLHETYLQQWRLQILNGLGKDSTQKKTKQNKADIKRIKALEKELRRKDKALAETAALLVLKKKVQQIWGDEDDNTGPKNEK